MELYQQILMLVFAPSWVALFCYSMYMLHEVGRRGMRWWYCFLPQYWLMFVLTPLTFVCITFYRRKV